MFNMVVLIYIFLHSSKYSISTVNKPSHNVSFFSIWHFCGHLIPVCFSIGHPEWQKNKNKTWHPHWQPPETRQRNTTHQISRTLTDLLSLNNGTDWMILTKHHHLHWEGYITRIPNTWNQEWSQHKRASYYYFEEVIVLVALKEFVRLSFDVSMIIATNVTSSYLREIYFYA